VRSDGQLIPASQLDTALLELLARRAGSMIPGRSLHHLRGDAGGGDIGGIWMYSRRRCAAIVRKAYSPTRRQSADRLQPDPDPDRANGLNDKAGIVTAVRWYRAWRSATVPNKELDRRNPSRVWRNAGGLPEAILLARCAHPLVAVTAIDRLVRARDEGNQRMGAAFRADSGMHLTLGTALAVVSGLPVRPAQAHPLAPKGAATRAPPRLVHQPPARVELLLTGRENELIPALAALQNLVGIAHGDLQMAVGW